ncbi:MULTISPECIES: RNA polymerase sigma factor [unclassified Streptomyces]|uniref:RNA polymerase sigma factor n=1 Tax=unclassified Streptomyces TaxID=2593676 RepID=UPI00070A86FA|nr:sigma-70 family RNA polymerase sigma factor [Streptomyces sp. Root1310]KQX77053.1 hypothetical protein ASD48_38365 [Streptomyces sp. Root1310]
MSSEAPRTADEFESFFLTAYNPTVRRLLARETRLAQADAEDIVATAFAETQRNWSAVLDPPAFLWDRVTKRHIDFVRKRMATPEIPCALSAPVFVRPAPKDGEPEPCMDARRIEELISRLSPDDQRVIIMASWGATSAEQAKELGIEEGAFRVRLHRAKRRLRKLVDQEAEVR